MEWLRNLSPTREVVLITAIAFGLPIWISVATLVASSQPVEMSNGALIGMVFWEVLILALVVAILQARGWTVHDFKFEVSWKATGVGMLLLVATYVATILLQYFAAFLIGSSALSNPVFSTTGRLSLVLIASSSFFNAFFEEFLVAAYLITALDRAHGVFVAVNASVAIRLLYHLYQGPAGVAMIIPLGLFFALAYVRFRNLWPLLLAHAVIDLIGLASLPSAY